MRFEGLLERGERGELLQEEAAEMLGISERTFSAVARPVARRGAGGLRNRRIGKPSSRRTAAAEILRMLGLYEERYRGFTVKHFHEHLQKRHHVVEGDHQIVLPIIAQQPGEARGVPRFREDRLWCSIIPTTSSATR
jgi:hypothetical protein